MDILNISYEQFEVFLLAFARISSIVALVPILGSMSAPFQLKAGLSLMLSLIIFPVLPVKDMQFYSIFPFVVAIFREVIIGITIGYTSRLIFSAVQLAGQIEGFQMGFAIVNVFDPTTSSQVSVISEFKYILAILIFLSMSAHHFIIKGIVQSFHFIPFTSFNVFNGALFKIIVTMFGDIFTVAIKISAPMIAAILFINVALGLVARTVPQINIFVVGFPIQICVGLIVLGLSMQAFYYMIVKIYTDYYGSLQMILKSMG